MNLSNAETREDKDAPAGLVNDATRRRKFRNTGNTWVSPGRARRASRMSRRVDETRTSCGISASRKCESLQVSLPRNMQCWNVVPLTRPLSSEWDKIRRPVAQLP